MAIGYALGGPIGAIAAAVVDGFHSTWDGLAASVMDIYNDSAFAGNPINFDAGFKSQVETSCTYGGAISGYFTGGLNFQVEHHLFPRMSSAWYPYIAPTVRRVCAKHNVLPEIEMTSIQEINQAWERVVSGDVKYRFVIDMATLKSEKHR